MLIALLAMLENEEDKQNLAALYEEYHDRMEQTALRILGASGDAEDAVQNAFVKVITHFEKIYSIPREELPVWLVMIVRNESISILRKRSRMIVQEDMDSFEHPSAPVLSYQDLVACLRSMPQNYRSLMEMKLVLGYSDAETAKCLGISETAVSTRAGRARKVLREIIEKEAIHFER